MGSKQKACEEWNNLFWTTFNELSDKDMDSLKVFNDMKDDAFLKDDTILKELCQIIIKRLIKIGSKYSEVYQTWYTMIDCPLEELPTLIGVREDLDEYISERLKE